MTFERLAMKSQGKKKLFITLCIIFLWFGVVVEQTKAQDGPSIGRPDKPAQPNNPPNNNPKPRKKRPTVDKNGIPTGKSMEFYVRKGSELIDTGEFEMAALYFDEADKRRKERGVTVELIDLLEKQIQVNKIHLEADDLVDTEPENALAKYQEILKLRPNDLKAKEQIPTLYSKVADIALEKKDFQKASDLYSQLTALAPTDLQIRAKLVSALVGRGEAELEAGKQDQAENTFKRVLELEPKNEIAQKRLQALDILGILEFAENKLKAGAYEDALTKFKEVLALDPDNERAKQSLPLAQGNYQKQKAEQLYKNRKYSEADQEYKAALVLLPEDEDIKKRLDELVLRLSPAPAARGKSVWRGKVIGTVKVSIKGQDLEYPEGTSTDASLSERLPDYSYTVKRVRRLSGTSNVRLLEQPTSSNSYATVVSIDSKKADTLGFEVEWELKRLGVITWKGQVAGRSLIRVQGPFVDVEQIGGEPAKNTSYQGDPLPKQETAVKVRKLNGKFDLRLVEMPSAANSYIATIAVDGTESETDDVSFELSWQLK